MKTHITAVQYTLAQTNTLAQTTVRGHALNATVLNATALTGTGFLALAVASSLLTARADASTVTLNGQVLPTSVAPIQRNGRTLVPMRDIFQALGARVIWDNAAQGITARRGTTKIGLTIGDRLATVDGNDVTLEQAPIMYRGSTMVPLRFVAEAMGAQVRWSEQRQVAAITNSGRQVAGVQTINVPSGTVVKVNLRNELSSATSRVGDQFTATVDSQNQSYLEFPSGSRVEGVVREVQAKSGSNPGVLDLNFRTMVLPDGSRYPLEASLISLDNKSVETSSSGRITARKGVGQSSADRLKVVGIGAGAGFLVGKLLKKNSTLTAVLGAAGGYLYSTQANKDKAREAVLSTGTDLGVRIDRDVAYRNTAGAYARTSMPVRQQ